MTETKKISLNFKQLADASVQHIASATFGRDNGQDLKLFLAPHLKCLESDKGHFTILKQMGDMYVKQINSSFENLHYVLARLEKARPPSLMARLLSQGGVTTPDPIETTEKRLKSCDDVVRNLRHNVDQARRQLRAANEREEMLEKTARQLGGQEGIEVMQCLAQYRADTADTLQGLEKLADVSRDFEKACTKAHEKADELIKKQKTYLSGAKVRP